MYFSSSGARISNSNSIGKPQKNKKVLLLMAGPLRPNPILELNGRWNVGTSEKRLKKKLFFPQWPCRPFTPPPLIFFVASLSHNKLMEGTHSIFLFSGRTTLRGWGVKPSEQLRKNTLFLLFKK